jgi:hypothetical protein
MNLSAQSGSGDCLKEIVTVNITAVMHISPRHQCIWVPMTLQIEER